MITDILFNEAEHKYYDERGNTYISVTTLIGKYTETYDTEFWAMYIALKEHNLKVKPEPKLRKIYIGNHLYKLEHLLKDALYKHWYAEIRAKWNGINAEACLRGNTYHNDIENGINQSKGDWNGSTNNLISIKGEKVIKTIHDLDKTNFKDKYPIIYDRLSGYIHRGFSIFAEKKVFLEEYRVAGMIDCPLLIQMYFAILDWKTNKDELHTTAGYYKKKLIGDKWVKTKEWVETGDRFKYPLNMLEASKFNIYALQLSTYAYILEQWGYTLLNNGLEIIHFPVGTKPDIIKIPYLKDEVKIMLEHYKQTTLQSEIII